MAKSLANAVRRHIHQLVGKHKDSQATDRELLQRFTKQQDEAAFEILVRRHQALVLAAGRRVLGNAHDAEDVCQAAFLLLAQKASARGWQPSVANWLYRTANLLALKVRTAAARRARREERAAPRPAINPLAGITGQELLGVLDEELLALPEPLRAPLVLCYREGATRDEAAQRLGLPLATLKNRLERGRAQLRAALVRRGLGLSTVLLSTLLTRPTANAVAAIVLALRTARAALALTHGKPTDGLVSSPVSRLVQGGLPSMSGTKFKSALAVLLVVGLLATAGVFASGAREDKPAGPQRKAPMPLARNASRPATTTPRAQGILLRYRFKQGDKCHYVVTWTTETATTAGGVERVVKTTQTYNLTWKVTGVDTDGNAQMTQTVDRVRFSMGSGVAIAAPFEFDSRKGRKGKGPMGRILAPVLRALVGAQFTCTLSPRGEVRAFKVPKKVRAFVKKTKGVAGLFSAETFKLLASPGGIILPRSPVRKGDSWNQKTPSITIWGPAQVTVDNRATYQGKTKRGGKRLEEIGLAPRAATDRAAGGRLRQLTLKNQEGKGSLLFDNARGRLIETRGRLNLDLVITVGGGTIIMKKNFHISARLD
jgi:RNA polymerase sigma factor (sigma-70 family)